MAEQSEQSNQYAGSAELVGIMQGIMNARMAYPDNPKIADLYNAIQPMMDASLCEALLLQTGQLQQEVANQRRSPLAKMMAAEHRS